MEFLLAGLLLFTLLHFVPSLFLGLKRTWLGALGEGSYKATFSLIAVLSIAIITYGWQHTVPVHINTPLQGLRAPSMALIFVALILFGCARLPTRIKTYIRHPQLVSVIFWSMAHLLNNGDSRSLILFGWMGVWAAVDIMLINRREGVWIKEPPPPWTAELKVVVIGAILYGVLVYAHPYIAGVPII